MTNAPRVSISGGGKRSEPIVLHGKFVAYYRVSAAQPGRSGQGVEAQRQSVEAYLDGGHWRIVGEFTEVESGKRSERPELEKALAAARSHKAALVVAKVDRLTRSVAFLSRLLEADVDVRFCDLPAIEGPAGRFMLQRLVAVAALEAGLISSRTRAALAQAKRRGVKLGGYRAGAKLTAKARAKGRAVREAKADAFAADIAPTIIEIQQSGVTSLTGIAKELTERSIPAARGGLWTATQVGRILARR